MGGLWGFRNLQGLGVYKLWGLGWVGVWGVGWFKALGPVGVFGEAYGVKCSIISYMRFWHGDCSGFGEELVA